MLDSVRIKTGADLSATLARARAFADHDLHATKAEYNKKDDLITLHLADGVRVSIPRKKLQGLQDAKPAQLAQIALLGRGTGLHWPELDFDHYVPELLNRVFGTARWMAEIGRIGGSARSSRKKLAARANGKKGGRPKSVREWDVVSRTAAGD
jgi:Protein of unknown function (DUF2442)